MTSVKAYLRQTEKECLSRHPDATPEEKKLLREWILSGNSADSNPGLATYESGSEMDFIDGIRFDEDMRKAFFLNDLSR
ncbi:MAG: hypothetical protein HUJ99_02585 [Bacteroidaceae bacterium]|nr:hypothetical protein [Bacteroidaceae bacterium]